MPTIRPSPFLKFALLADACISGAAGLLHLGATSWLSTLTNLPHALLLGTGEFFVVYALVLVAMATRARLASALVRVVAIGNVLWALASLGLLLGGALPLPATGIAYVLAQAMAVLVFAALQWHGLRSSSPAEGTGRAVMS